MKTNKKDILSILLGNTLLALAVILFIVPGHLLSGGTTSNILRISFLFERLFWERNLLYKHLFQHFIIHLF